MEFLTRHQNPLHESSSELKLFDRRDSRAPYVGANLQTSRSPSAIDYHCRTSYNNAKRKLHSSRAKVRFYVAGDNNHSAIYAVSPQRFTSFDSLLGSLTKTPLCTNESNKERYVFSLNGSRKITSLDELQSGESYVCATYDVFEQLSDDKARPVSTLNKYKSLQNAALAAARPTHTSQSTRSRQSVQVEAKELSEESQFLAEMKPRLITVLKGGAKPRRSVRILLNKKNTRSFEQIIDGIGDIICPREQVKRLFGISGRLVMCLADFYLEDSVFFAYSSDKMNPDDLFLDSTEVKFVGAYRFRQASAYGRVTLTSHQKRMTNERPRSIPASAMPGVYRLTSESRNASRVQSCKQSAPSTPKHQTIEKETIEPMEKKHEQVFVDASNPTPPRAGSQSSIRTLTPESEKSQHSINLTPSHSPNTRPPPSSPTKTLSARQSPTLLSNRQSPEKEHHPSEVSQSNRQTPIRERRSSAAVPSARQTPSRERHTSGTLPSARQTPAKERHRSGISDRKASLPQNDTKPLSSSNSSIEESQENKITKSEGKITEGASITEESRSVRNSPEPAETKSEEYQTKNGSSRGSTRSLVRENMPKEKVSNGNNLPPSPTRKVSGSESPTIKQMSRRDSPSSNKPSDSPTPKPKVSSRPESVASKVSHRSTPVSALDEGRQSVTSQEIPTEVRSTSSAAETKQPDVPTSETEQREQTEASKLDSKQTEGDQTSILSASTSHKDDSTPRPEVAKTAKDPSPTSEDANGKEVKSSGDNSGRKSPAPSKAGSISKVSETSKAETGSKSSGVNEDDYSVDFEEMPPGPDDEVPPHPDEETPAGPGEETSPSPGDKTPHGPDDETQRSPDNKTERSPDDEVSPRSGTNTLPGADDKTEQQKVSNTE